jgi:hypothetical protein
VSDFGPQELRFMTLSHGEVQLTFPSTSALRIGSKPYDFYAFTTNDIGSHGFRVAHCHSVYARIEASFTGEQVKTKQVQVNIAEQVGRGGRTFVPYIGISSLDFLEEAVHGVTTSIEYEMPGTAVPAVRLLPLDGHGNIKSGRNLRADAVAWFNMKIRPMAPPPVLTRNWNEDDDEMRERAIKALEMTAAPQVKSEEQLFLERLQAKMRERYGT